MEEPTMNLDTLIREVNPAPAETVPGPDSFEARAILEHLRIESSPRRRRPVLVGGLTLGSLGAEAAAALLVANLLPGSPARPTSAAAATFVHLAKVAASQPATSPPGPGQYEYTESDGSNDDCTNEGSTSFYCYFLPEQRQIWIGADGSGRILETFGTLSFVTPADRAAWVSAGSPSISTTPSDTTFGPHTLSDGPGDLASLPTDPSALGAELSARKIEGGPPGPAEDFVQIGDLLRETDASPALRAAVYQVAADIPGAILLGTVTDHSGRSGIGIARVNDDGVEQEYVFDPTTSALLGEEQLATSVNAGGEGVSAGTVLGWAVYLSSGIVDSLSDTPTGTVTPAPPVTCTAVTTPPTTLPGAVPVPGTVPGSDVYPAICKG
jgi:hypothetical protein